MTMILYQPIPLAEAIEKAHEMGYDKGRVQNSLGSDYQVYKSVSQVCNTVSYEPSYHEIWEDFCEVILSPEEFPAVGRKLL